MTQAEALPLDVTTGAAYDPAADRWRPIPEARAPSPRQQHTATWTGSEIVVWGGAGVGKSYADVGRYDPAIDQWTPVSAVGATSPRYAHSAVWTGTEVLVWGGLSGFTMFQDGGRFRPDAGAAPATAPPVMHDERYFAETGYHVDDASWDYFNRRGSTDIFGYPVSRTFALLGCSVQMFQRQIAQHCPDQGVQLMNLLDPDVFPYTRVNGSTFPAPDPALKAATPQVSSASYVTDILAFIGTNVEDTFEGQPVHFASTFISLVTPEMAGSASPRVLGLVNLEVWGAPISHPLVDPGNPQFIYQRFQRGIMHYDASTGVTRGILLADYLQAILRNSADLPDDLREQAGGSRYFRQYCPGASGWLCRPDELPGTDLTFAFEPA